MGTAIWSAIALVAALSMGTLFLLISRIDGLVARIDGRLDSLGARIDGLSADTSARFDALAAAGRHAG